MFVRAGCCFERQLQTNLTHDNVKENSAWLFWVVVKNYNFPLAFCVVVIFPDISRFFRFTRSIWILRIQIYDCYNDGDTYCNARLLYIIKLIKLEYTTLIQSILKLCVFGNMMFWKNALLNKRYCQCFK